MRTFLRSKIHNATVTEANVHYVGSVTVDEELMIYADIAEFEKVLVVNNANGARLETYVIKGGRGTGVIGMNGAAAHLMKNGDQVIIMSFETAAAAPVPKCILVDKNNKFVKYLVERAGQSVC
ncbi:MAG: aspartate 1-decarboxylase [Planctomycetes bacterium]|nr:aspartate 1-decarboxylase [Planctomycetota bacterium]